MSRSIAARVAAMDRGEAWFRLRCELRKSAGRLRAVAGGDAWDRADAASVFASERCASPDWERARTALAQRDYLAAHRALSRHFATAGSPFPIDAGDVPRIAAAVLDRHPGAGEEAKRRADALLEGRYDLLGYRGVPVERPVDWHKDHVHGRRAPLKYWAAVPYLDPAVGDHKVIWELNRHQHWLALGRAFALTGDARYYEEFVAQLQGWIAANPPLTGINWASMLELGFRSLSWLWALRFFAGPAAAAAGDAEPWTVDLLLALDRQLTHVEHNLSRYFSPNTHLTGEALALYVAGRSLPHLAASARRAAAGRAVLLQEAARQVRDDGGHAELSGHYHRYSTDFYLLAAIVARRSGDPAAPRFEEAARRQARFLRAICDDLGRRPQFGDDDGGQLFPICGRDAADCRDTFAVAAVVLDEPALAMGPAAEEALWLCGPAAALREAAAPRAEAGSAALASSGYFVSRGGGDQLVLDAGPHGYLNGGHAHADSLSVAGTVRGLPLLVDAGTATYTMDPGQRDLFRSTAMHNTVVLDGRPQSVPRGPFHWSRVANGRGSMWRAGSGCDYVEGTHDGYLPRRHTRAILSLHGIGWWILDHLLGDGAAQADVHWHLHPAWDATSRSGHSVELRQGNVKIWAAAADPLSILAPGTHPLAHVSPAYGVIVPAPVLRSAVAMTLPATLATFFATGGPCRGLAVERRPVTLAPPDAWHASAFRAHWAGGRITVLSAIERSGVASDDAARPGALWGTREFTTDARAAAVLELAGQEPEIVLINGTTVVSAGQGTALAALSQPSSILRTSSGLAPAVHPLAVRRLDRATAHRTSRPLSSSS